jgi:hypothetical protein
MSKWFVIYPQYIPDTNMTATVMRATAAGRLHPEKTTAIRHIAGRKEEIPVHIFLAVVWSIMPSLQSLSMMKLKIKLNTHMARYGRADKPRF